MAQIQPIRLYITICALTRIEETIGCIESLLLMHDVDKMFFNILYSDNCPAEYAISKKEFEEKIIPIAKFPKVSFTQIEGLFTSWNCRDAIQKYKDRGMDYDAFCWLESDVVMNPDWVEHITRLYADLTPKYKLGFTTPLDIKGATSRMYKKKWIHELYKSQTHVPGNTFIIANDVCKILPMDGGYWENGWERNLCYHLLAQGYTHVCTGQSHGRHIGKRGLTYNSTKWMINDHYDNFIPAPEIESIYRRFIN